MGASSSKSSLEVVNQSIIDVITSNMNQCSSSINAVQDNTVTGVDLFGRNVQNVTLDQTCTQNITVDNQMIADMANKIQQAANAKTVSLLPGYAGSANNQKLKTYLSSKITTENVQQAMASVSAVQINRVEAGGTALRRVNVQNITSVQSALQKLLNTNRVAQALVTDTTQSSASTTDTNPIAQIFSAISGAVWAYILIFIILIVLLIVIVAVYKKLTGDPAGAQAAMGPGDAGEEAGLDVAEDGKLIGPDGNPILDAAGMPIYVNEDGFEVDESGKILQVDGKPVKVNPDGTRNQADGAPVSAAKMQSLRSSTQIEPVKTSTLGKIAETASSAASAASSALGKVAKPASAVLGKLADSASSALEKAPLLANAATPGSD